MNGETIVVYYVDGSVSHLDGVPEHWRVIVRRLPVRVTTWQAVGVGVGAGLIVVSLVEAYIIFRWGSRDLRVRP